MSKKTDTIELLPEHIIDQIKAGEVIERPSTLLKELLENAVDAGAKKIDIEIKNNGIDLISVKDDGKGIPFDQLELAFCRHATSKISRFEDIYGLYTYGFRGEALASIAAISKVTCTTKQKNGPESLIRIHGSEIMALTHDDQSGDDQGTLMRVQDLFFNTPVRMKFIQSKTAEKNQLDKIIKAFLLTCPHINFSVKWDDQDKDFYPAQKEGDLDKRVKEVLFNKKGQHDLLQASGEYDSNKFNVFLTSNSTKGHASRSHFLFINNRYIQDVQIRKIILNSAQALWPIGEAGSYCAYLDIPSDRIDVNIHPNKTQVKIFESSRILSLVSSSVKKLIQENISRANPGENHGQEAWENASLSFQSDDSPPLDHEKTLQYKNYQHHDSGNELRQYFKKLDDNGVTGTYQRKWSRIKDFKSLSLYQNHELEHAPLFSLHRGKLMKHFFVKALGNPTEKSRQNSTIPLLVSRPLKTQLIPSAKQIAELKSYGFEIDFLSQNTLVLRSFPEGLKNFPFQSFLSVWIDSTPEKMNFKDSLAKLSFDPKLVESSHITNLLEGSNLSELIEADILHEVREKQFEGHS